MSPVDLLQACEPESILFLVIMSVHIRAGQGAITWFGMLEACAPRLQHLGSNQHALRCAHLTVPWLLRRCLVTFSLLVALLVAASASEDNVDLPVATEGTKEWVALVAQAMSLGGRDQEQSLQALSSFQSSTMAKLQKKVSSLLE